MSHLSYIVQYKCQKESTYNKIILRRLPPNFTLKIFKEQVYPLPPYNYLCFVPAHKQECVYSFSRAYINFIRHEDVYHFKEKYDNYVFIGAKGMEYYAVVEFAPYQGIPKNRLFPRDNNVSGTIQDNIYFKQFLDDLKITEHRENSEYNFQPNLQNRNTFLTTPLLKFISAKKSEQTKERKRDAKHSKNDNCLIFIHSSVKKCGIHRSDFKRYA